MPEGDSLLRMARALHRALAGKVITSFWSPRASLEGIELEGARVSRVDAKGKNVLVSLDDGRVIHTHMMMDGAWHLYRPGMRWQMSRADARAIVETSDVIAVCFLAPVVRVLRPDSAQHDPRLRDLGPDILEARFDAQRATKNLRADGDRIIARALLDQRAVAGIGNIWRAESLYASGVSPTRAVASLSDEELGAILANARRMMSRAANDRRAPMRVYGRAGKPCPRCAQPIAREPIDGRGVYFCRSCQK
jgi:endonuclease-8